MALDERQLERYSQEFILLMEEDILIELRGLRLSCIAQVGQFKDRIGFIGNKSLDPISDISGQANRMIDDLERVSSLIDRYEHILIKAKIQLMGERYWFLGGASQEGWKILLYLKSSTSTWYVETFVNNEKQVLKECLSYEEAEKVFCILIGLPID